RLSERSCGRRSIPGRRGALWLFSVGPWAGRGVVPAGWWPVLRRTAGAALSASTHYGSQVDRPCLTDGSLMPDRWGRSCLAGGRSEERRVGGGGSGGGGRRRGTEA